MHRLDRINANKPAKLLDSKSLTLGFRVKQFGRFFYVIRTGERNLAGERVPTYLATRLDRSAESEANPVSFRDLR